MTYPFLLPLRALYNYWFHTNDNFQVRHDFCRWVRFILGMTVCYILYGFHTALKLVLALVQVLPFWSILSFWPRFYWHIMTDPARRSFYQILTDPTYSEAADLPSSPRVTRFTRRRFVDKGKVRVRPTLYRLRVLSSYQVWGAYAFLGTSARDALAAVASTAGKIYSDDPARLSVAYTYFRDIADEPPDNVFSAHFGLLRCYFRPHCFGTLRLLADPPIQEAPSAYREAYGAPACSTMLSGIPGNVGH